MSILRDWPTLLLWSAVVFFGLAIIGNTYRALDYQQGINEARAPVTGHSLAREDAARP